MAKENAGIGTYSKPMLPSSRVLSDVELRDRWHACGASGFTRARGAINAELHRRERLSEQKVNPNG